MILFVVELRSFHSMGLCGKRLESYLDVKTLEFLDRGQVWGCIEHQGLNILG